MITNRVLSNLGGGGGGDSFDPDVANVAIGEDAAAGTNSVAIGRLADAGTVSSSIAVGYRPIVTANSAHAMGIDATATAGQAQAIGRKTTASGSAANAIGNNATASGSESNALGGSAQASGAYSNAFGTAQAVGDYSNAFGRGAVVTENNATVWGSALYPNKNHYFGRGAQAANADDDPALLSATSGLGTDNPGGDIELAGGRGTGSGAGGSAKIRTAPAGSTGSSLNTLVDRLEADTNGVLWVNTVSTAPTVGRAGQVGLFVEAGALKAIHPDNSVEIFGFV